MGNGRKNTPDVPKAPPYAAHQALVADARLSTNLDVDAAVQPGGGLTAVVVDFCELTHRLAVQLAPGVAPRANEPIRVVLAPLPRVVGAEGEELWTLTAAESSAIRQCLINGYDFAGEIASVDSARRHAEVWVRGAKVE